MAGKALILVLALATSVSHAVICYGVNGIPYPKQVTCPGTNACCGEEGTCLDNKLCHNPGEDQDVFTRGPCSTRPWDEENCATICVYNETVYHDNHFPRVNRCDNGSFCCSNEPNCCREGDGVFLDEKGNIVDKESSSASSAPSSTSPSSPPTETPSDEPAPATTDSTGFKVGLGLGIPLAAAVAGFGVWFLLRRRQRPAVAVPGEDPDGVAGTKYSHQIQPVEYHTENPTEYSYELGAPPSELEGPGPGPVELGAQPDDAHRR